MTPAPHTRHPCSPGRVVAGACAALLLFVPLFVTRGFGALDFWWSMSGAILALLALAATLDPLWLPAIVVDVHTQTARKIGLGFVSAAALYLIFMAGRFITVRTLPFAAPDIDAVYGLKGGFSTTRMVILMIFVIGPGEELFWRGFLQKNIAAHSTPHKGLFGAALLYTVVHVGSGNIMLITAALVAGLFWGWLYNRYHSVLLNAVSHTAWDVAIFFLLPLGSR